MLRADPKIQRQILQLLDAGVTVGSFALAFLIRSKVLTFLPPCRWPTMIGMCSRPCWWIGFRGQGTYMAQRFTSLRTEFERVLRTAVLGTLVFIGLLYLLKWSFVPVNIVLLFLNRVLIYGVIQRVRRKGYDRKRVLIVGTGDPARRFVETMAGHLEWGLDIVGFVGPNPLSPFPKREGGTYTRTEGPSSPPRFGEGTGEGSHPGEVFCGAPILGTFEDLASLLRDHPVDEVIFTVSTRPLGALRDLIEICETHGTPFRLVSDFFRGLASRLHADGKQ